MLRGDEAGPDVMGKAFGGRALLEPDECAAGALVQGGTGAQDMRGGDKRQHRSSGIGRRSLLTVAAIG